MIIAGVMQEQEWEQMERQFREIAAAEIASGDDSKGTARLLDLNRDPSCGYLNRNPRAAERIATLRLGGATVLRSAAR